MRWHFSDDGFDRQKDTGVYPLGFGVHPHAQGVEGPSGARRVLHHEHVDVSCSGVCRALLDQVEEARDQSAVIYI